MVGTLLRIPEVLGSDLSQKTGCSADVCGRFSRLTLTDETPQQCPSTSLATPYSIEACCTVIAFLKWRQLDQELTREAGTRSCDNLFPIFIVL
jgi:hypothetical protein